MDGKALFIVLLQALIYTQIADGALQLKVNPSLISPGLTSSLTVNCTFSYTNAPNVASLMSLIISKQDLNISDAQNFTELVSLNAFSGDHVSNLDDVKAEIAGHIGTSDTGFLSLQWKFPFTTDAGLYRCDAHVLDDTGHPTYLVSSADVTSQEPTMDILIKEVGLLQSEVEVLTIKRQEEDKKREEMLTGLFERSIVYYNRYYLLSKHYWTNVDVVETVCEHYGGYLVEIDSSVEHNFLKNFLIIFQNVSTVLIGNHKVNDNQWIYRFSRKPATYLDWYTNEPDDEENNCAVLQRDKDFQMLDSPCYDVMFTKFNFLCEVTVD